MRKTIFAVLVLLLTVSAVAQEAPKGEIYGGYTYVRENLADELSVVGLDKVNANGWTAGGAGFFNDWFGIKGEITGVYARPEVDLGSIVVPFETSAIVTPTLVKLKLDTYTYTFGPTIAYRKSKVQPFAHALFGLAHVKLGAEAAGVGADAGTDNAFAMQFGGGADFVLGKSFAVRGGLDWVHTSFDLGVSSSQNHMKVLAGVVYRFGGK
jgi:hypothetical protein